MSKNCAKIVSIAQSFGVKRARRLPAASALEVTSDREGASAFYEHKGAVYHTYSTYARGIDLLNSTYNWLDLTAKGRDEGDMGQFWVKFHDRY